MSVEPIDLFKALLYTSKTAVRTVFARCGLGQETNLTGPQFGLLMNLHHRGPMSPSELCEIMLVTPANITGMISRLKKLGLVERRRLTTDRRCLKLGLTPLGHEKLMAIIPVWEETASACITGFSERDRQHLFTLLNKLREVINTHAKQS
ncbi:MAG TPA: MarR family transcriptional regulator [Candidatus Ozemobacteraceae bacterium]